MDLSKPEHVMHAEGAEVAPISTSTLRARFRREGLDPKDATDPLSLVVMWRRIWAQTRPFDPAAATLATVTPDGCPALRWMDVLDDPEGFVFLTDYGSSKALDLTVNPLAELCFGYLEIGRQMRIAGRVEQLSAVASDLHFAEQPRTIQLLVWASQQSELVTDRSQVQQAIAVMQDRFEGQEIPRPRHWGGYRLSAERIEFWQERADHLQDRLVCERAGKGCTWRITRLSP